MSIDLEEIWFSEKLVNAVGWGGTDTNWHEFLAPISISGISIEGLSLRGRAAKNFVDRAVLLQLELQQSSGPVLRLARVCWRPFGVHNNANFGPVELQMIDQMGTHFHTFEDNYLRHEARMRAGNLKVAVPIQPDYPTCRKFIDETGKLFRINNMHTVELPPAQAVLL